jgi:branched-chain amino acid transport system ATP-binding protein
MNSLTISGLSSGYHNTTILRDVDLNASQSAVTCLLGRNGVGKSTLMKTIMGIIPNSSGSIVLGKQVISGLKPFQIAKLGIAYAPQESSIFPQLTVEQNFTVACGKFALSDHKEVFEFFPRLAERLKQVAGTLSGGEQKMLLVARALMSKPKFMLLDEVTEGVQPSIVNSIGKAILWSNRELGTTVLMVEQNLELALGISHYYAMMDNGSIVDQGPVAGEETSHKVKQRMVI